MHQYQETDRDEDRNPDEKSRVKEIWKEEGVLDRTKWKHHSHNHSGDFRCLEKPEEKKVHNSRTNVDKSKSRRMTSLDCNHLGKI